MSIIVVSGETNARLPRHHVQANLFRQSQAVQVKGRQMEVNIFIVS